MTASVQDPVRLALVQSRLDHITRQMGWVMTRTARSPIFSHAHDFSCFLTDRDGVIVAQADGLPIHTGGGGFAVRAMLATIAGPYDREDAFLLNDPYAAGGNHLPDWVVIRPVMREEVLLGFSCIRAHQSDIGGGAAGTYNPAAREIFHEGLRLPPMRLVEAGMIREDLWQLLLLNSRTPHYLDGDLRAMMGATRIGAEQLVAIADAYGSEGACESLIAILDHAERRMRQAIAALPDGTYVGEDRFDNDCFQPMDIPIRATVRVSGDRLTVDFTGSHPQIDGFKNSSLANTHSAVYTALSAFFPPDLPRNEGTYRAVEIIAPEGSIVNARAPAPMTMCTVFPACEIIHAVWQALGQADPARSCAGWGKNATPVASGRYEDGRTFVMYHWFGSSGGGAVAGRDGFPQQGGLMSLCGLRIPNAESFEQLYPVRFVRQELRCDAAGPGAFRGGSGADYVVDIHAPVQFAFRGEGIGRSTGFGAAGGRSGAATEIVLRAGDGAPVAVPAYGIQSAGPCRLEIRSAGGGGWGSPFTRDPEKVLADVRDGLISEKSALRDYGVALTSDGLHVDPAATARCRQMT